MLGATVPFQVDAGAVSILRLSRPIGRGGRRRQKNLDGRGLMMHRPTGKRH